MKMVLIDETKLEARVVDCDPQKRTEMLQGLMPEMDCPGHVIRAIGGVEYSILHDDEFLYHGRNVSGLCESFSEVLMGSLLIAGMKDDDDYEDDDPDWGLRGLTDEECETILKAWKPVSPPLAEKYGREVHPSLLFLMGSNVLHYE